MNFDELNDWIMSDGAKQPADETRFVRHLAGRPEPIGELSERGLRIFNAACDSLEAAEALSLVDGGLIYRYADTLDSWLNEIALLKTEGMVLESEPHKRPLRNPRGPVVKALGEEIARCEKALGFSPESRGRLAGFKLNPKPKEGEA